MMCRLNRLFLRLDMGFGFKVPCKSLKLYMLDNVLADNLTKAPHNALEYPSLRSRFSLQDFLVQLLDICFKSQLL